MISQDNRIQTFNRSKKASTTIAREYPPEYLKKPTYPIIPSPKKKNRDIYRRYRVKFDEFDNLILLGRLAEYQYYNMDKIVAVALKTFEEKIHE
jgi:UDP-galactopyranose mutase